MSYLRDGIVAKLLDSANLAIELAIRYHSAKITGKLFSGNMMRVPREALRWIEFAQSWVAPLAGGYKNRRVPRPWSRSRLWTRNRFSENRSNLMPSHGLIVSAGGFALRKITIFIALQLWHIHPLGDMNGS